MPGPGVGLVQFIDLFEIQTFEFGNEKVDVGPASDVQCAPDESHIHTENRMICIPRHHW